MQRRDILSLERNRLVAILLRKLEYYSGIFFLTTNLASDFDGAVLNRVHIHLMYQELDLEARKRIWITFLRNIEFDSDELHLLAQVPLNGRDVGYLKAIMRWITSTLHQIKNNVAIGLALARQADTTASFSHIKTALKANGIEVPDIGASLLNESLYD